eukprot:g32762.t1
MEKCTEGIWVWSEVFVCKAGDEDVAVVLMDTQGAWDARMSKDPSRLIYNVSKQIQQDKIDNLLYFTDFAKAALRAMQRGTGSVSEPFQTLEFLVRDWPHYQDVATGELKYLHVEHCEILSVGDLKLCKAIAAKSQVLYWLRSPNCKPTGETWNGDLAVIEKQFWRYIDGYLDKIFDPAQLQAKQNLGNAITVSTFGTVLREFSSAFSDAAPQAQTFSEAMEASTGLLARDVAIKKAKKILADSWTQPGVRRGGSNGHKTGE